MNKKARNALCMLAASVMALLSIACFVCTFISLVGDPFAYGPSAFVPAGIGFGVVFLVITE